MADIDSYFWLVQCLHKLGQCNYMPCSLWQIYKWSHKS